MIMTNWRLKILEKTGGQVRFALMRGEVAIGVATVPLHEFDDIVVQLMKTVFDAIRPLLAKSLGDLIWMDATSTFDGDTEKAKQALTRLGWTSVKVGQFADQLSKSIIETLTEKLPS